MLASTCHASLHGCVFDQEFVPHTPGTVLDSGAQVNIVEGTLGSGTRIQLTGITGATTEAERTDAMFPVLAADGSRHATSIRGKNIVATRTTDNILSLAVLLKAGYNVDFRVGTDLDPSDGVDLHTPKSKRIALDFSGNLWSLPLWTSPSRCASTAGIPIKYARAMIETGTRHTILICACTNPEEVRGILRTFRLSLLISNVNRVL
jgi:hypothetical protein